MSARSSKSIMIYIALSPHLERLGLTVNTAVLPHGQKSSEPCIPYLCIETQPIQSVLLSLILRWSPWWAGYLFGDRSHFPLLSGNSSAEHWHIPPTDEGVLKRRHEVGRHGSCYFNNCGMLKRYTCQIHSSGIITKPESGLVRTFSSSQPVCEVETVFWEDMPSIYK